MTREQLKELGLAKEVIDKIMDVNGADITAAKKELEVLKAERDGEKTRAEALQAKIDELMPLAQDGEAVRKELDGLKALQKETEERSKADAADRTLTDSIKAVFGDRKFINEYTEKAVVSQIKAEYGKPENTAKGIAKIFEELTKDRSGIFASSNPVLPPRMGGVSDNNIAGDRLRAVMGLKPI